ncbi:MAG: MBL fold metallo-hydrolase [Candidatus Bipolaricaulota bacterium]|nr:MAG: MBL fold metallo-hydrolase [Candidatus Bipolaricaulota bacterium]
MSRGICVLAFLCAISGLTAFAEDSQDLQEISVRYLGANGWVVTVGTRMLIFDYQEGTDPSPPPGSDRNLSSGYVTPAELMGFEVYVFVTHSHLDHYDPVILTWEPRLEEITYFFGWSAGEDPGHHYLDEWRETASVGGMEVYTIYSHHSNVSEVAYLVTMDDLIVYHNGDYKAEYEDDFAFLRTITEHIDLAFLIGHPFENHQYFLQALLMAELFDVSYIFPMNREGEAFRCHEYADLLADYGVDSVIIVAETRGEEFILDR